MQSGPEVVVTGCGVVTPLGADLDCFLSSLRAGDSAMRQLSVETQFGRHWYVASVDGFDARQYVQPRKAIKLICSEVKHAFGATMMACEAAKLTPGAIDPDRLGVCFGSEMIYSEIFEIQELMRHAATADGVDYDVWGRSFMSHIYPLWMLRGLPNMAACHASIALDARGPNNSIATDETASLTALHEAYLQIKRGRADAMIVGGASSYLTPTRYLQVPIEHYAADDVDPRSAVRPFADDRIGMARGEGAACLILESAEHAAARGAKNLATVASIAAGFRKPEKYRAGSAAAIAQVLNDVVDRAGIDFERVDHISSAGCGARELDAQAATGIAAVAPRTPVVAVQGGMGNIGAAMGLCELIASIMTANHYAETPWTLNCRLPDRRLGIDVVNEPGRRIRRPYIAKYSQTTHGQTAAVLVKLPDA